MVAALALPLLAWAWWSSFTDITIKIPLDGWSPIDWLNHLASPRNFVNDFPSGIENYGKSLPMLAYPFAFEAFGIAPDALLPFYIGAEILVFAAAILYLVRTLYPRAGAAVIVVALAIAVASRARQLDLAQFGGPYFWGLYYSFADALRLMAIALMLRGRYVAAGAFLGLTTATHLLLGVMTAAFLAFMHLSAPDSLKRAGPWLGVAVFVLSAGAWILIAFRSVAPTVSGIPDEQWLELTRMFSYHWYPSANDMLTGRRQVAFVPLLSYLLLTFYFLPRIGLDPSWVRQLRAGFLGLIALTCAGLVFSSVIPVPTMIRLALHRASDLIVLVAIPLVTIGLLREISAGSAWRGALAGGIVLSPFLSPPGFPVLLTLLLTLHIWRSLGGRRDDPWDPLLAVSAIGICVYLVAAEVVSGTIGPRSYTGGEAVLAATAAFAGVAFAVRRRPRLREVGLAIVAMAVVACGVRAIDERRIGSRAEASRAFREAQDWARKQTAVDALFLVDPTIYYGWRDFSRRSSFGNLREWLHTSWLYNPRADRFHEGLRRLKEFRLTPGPYAGRRPAIQGYLDLDNALRQRFYGANDDEMTRLARRNGITFIVARKDHETARRSLPTAFENRLFVVYAVPSR